MGSINQFVWTFPGGKKTIQKATAVVGNVPTVLTVPAGKIWLLLNANIVLTTDATVANRTPTIRTQDIANVVIGAFPSSVITASLTETRYWSRDINVVATTLNALGLQIRTAGEDVILVIVLGVVGDAYDYVLEYLEIDVP